MKKLLFFLVIATFLVLPMSAFSNYLYTDNMQASGFGNYDSVWNNWFTQYRTSDGDKIFCVENVPLNPNDVDYNFYTINDALTDYGLTEAYVNLLKETTWYANAWATGAAFQKDAQVAIWATLFTGMPSPTEAASGLMTAYANAGDKGAYTSDWLFAVNGSSALETIVIDEAYQNFLVAAPVPEPATMILFGIGLLGLAGISRRKL